MNPLLLLAVVVVVFLVLAILAATVLKQKAQKSPEEAPNLYVLKPSIFTAAERSFSGVLELIDLGELTITSKVRLADVIEVKPGLDGSTRQSAFNRIASKHVDFLLIQKSDGKPILGIELDDRSHQRANRMKRDEFLDTTFQTAGLPLLHIKAQATYDPRQILNDIETALNPPPLPTAQVLSA